MSLNSFNSRGILEVGDASYNIYRLGAVPGLERLPYSLKVLAENLLRTEDGANITTEHIDALANWDPNAQPNIEIQFTPARVIMQDFTGVPCVVDLATMREAVTALGGDPNKVNPLSPAEMVIDHSVILDVFGRADALGTIEADVGAAAGDRHLVTHRCGRLPVEGHVADGDRRAGFGTEAFELVFHAEAIEPVGEVAHRFVVGELRLRDPSFGTFSPHDETALDGRIRQHRESAVVDGDRSDDLPSGLLFRLRRTVFGDHLGQGEGELAQSVVTHR